MSKTTNNIFLATGASIEDMTKAMPKQVTESGFHIVENRIEYNGNPKALKFVIPVMKSAVSTLKSEGFAVVETPKTYVDKSGKIKDTKVVTFSFTDEAKAQILCDNVNRLIKAQYEDYKSKKK